MFRGFILSGLISWVVASLFQGMDIPREMFLFIMTPLAVMIITKLEYGEFRLSIPKTEEEEKTKE